jgi:hypothetical protein
VDYKFPFASVAIPDYCANTVENWTLATNDSGLKNYPKAKLCRLAWDFLFANENKQFIGTRHFRKQALAVMEQPKDLVLPNALLLPLVQELSLWVEGITNAANRSTLFSEWHSAYLEDVWFGSKLRTQLSFAGKNTYLNLLNLPSDTAQKLLQQIPTELEHPKPTRVVIVGNSSLYKLLPEDKRFLKIASIDEFSGSELLLILAINKFSMITDPISWLSLSGKLRDAGETLRYKLRIHSPTNNLFGERKLPKYPARQRVPTRIGESSLYGFFEPKSFRNHSFPSTIPAKMTPFLQKIKKFDSKLLLIGILPNQLRSLCKEQKMNDIEAALIKLSDTLFWGGYLLWKKRKVLVAQYWKTVAPQDWRLDYKEKKSRHKRRLEPHCKNPFHYCERVSGLSKQHRTDCACSDVKEKLPESKLPDIRSFMHKHPRRTSSIWNSFTTLEKSEKSFNALSREDLIRQQHDRGKRKRDSDELMF